MKVKKLSLTLSITLIAVLCLCFGCASFFAPISEASAAAGSYYSSVTATSGKELLGQLHDLIVRTHTTYTSYNDCRDKAILTDPGKAKGTVIEFYTHADISNSNFDNSGGWNREHVWAQSISNGLWGKSGAGSDLHHIRPAEKDINNHRGSKRYGEVSNGNPEYTSVMNVLGGYSNTSTFEPLDNVKGDVARIVMYVYTHYNKAANVGGTVECTMTCGNLPVTKIIAASNESDAWNLLLKWNKLDPVDDIERTRNEAVYGVQGNRNPFIDNEKYADAIWGDGTVETVKLESISIDTDSLTLAIGKTEVLKVVAKPSGASSDVVWTSSDNNVATVAADGVVTAKSVGSVTITATSVADSTKKATVTVTVREPTADEMAAINAFVNSVTTAKNASTLEDMHEAIVNALNNYKALLSEEKQNDNVKAAYSDLLSVVNSYNEKAEVHNSIFTDATKAFIIASTGTVFAALALAYVFKFSGNN